MADLKNDLDIETMASNVTYLDSRDEILQFKKNMYGFIKIFDWFMGLRILKKLPKSKLVEKCQDFHPKSGCRNARVSLRPWFVYK